MSVTVVVPFSSDDPHRVAAWRYVKSWWKANFPEWLLLPVGKTPFTKASAVNLGVQLFTFSDTLVIADADCFVLDVEGLKDLVRKVEVGQKEWVVPHKYVHRLGETSSRTIYEGGQVDLKGTRYPRYVGCIGGGLIALSRAAWDIVGGMDSRFETWGGEDVSFGLALQCLVGPETRGTLDLVHLYHAPLVSNYKVPEATARLIREYKNASRSQDRMRNLIGGKNAG